MGGLFEMSGFRQPDVLASGTTVVKWAAPATSDHYSVAAS